MKKAFIKLGLAIIAFFTKLLYLTLRISISKNSIDVLGSSQSSAVFCWHGGIGLLPYVNSYYRKTPIVGLVSNSRDGGYLAFFLSRFGILAERGSSSNASGGRAAINLIRILRKGGNICITPDGPRGPINKIKAGMLTVMEKSPNSRIIFIKIKFGKSWKFKSWDKFQIPKPFSKIDIDTFDFDNMEALKIDAAKKNISTTQYCEALLG